MGGSQVQPQCGKKFAYQEKKYYSVLHVSKIYIHVYIYIYIYFHYIKKLTTHSKI